MRLPTSQAECNTNVLVAGRRIAQLCKREGRPNLRAQCQLSLVGGPPTMTKVGFRLPHLTPDFIWLPQPSVLTAS